MKPILVDSGPLIALFNKSDRFHNVSVQFIKENKRQLVTSIANVTEAVYMLDFSKQAQAALLKWLGESSIIIEQIASEDLLRIYPLFEKYSNVPMDFADACIVHLAERLGTYDVLSVDSDFEIYRVNKKKFFNNLLVP
jgi:predicted nucleic acid-binding protein